MDVKRDDDDAMITLRRTMGSTCCHRQRLPQLRSRGLGQGCAEKDLHCLCCNNGGWWQQFFAMAADEGGDDLVAGGNEKGAKMNHPWLF